jgi:hypothetical protein
MERLGRSNRAARDTSLRSLSIDDSTRVLEGLISHPLVPPAAAPLSADHPVSLSHLRRARK